MLSPLAGNTGWCLSPQGIGPRDLDTLIELARRYRCQRFELGRLHSRVAGESPRREQLRQAREWREASDRAGLQMLLLGTGIPLVGCNAREREDLLHLARCAEILGCRHLRLTGGGHHRRTLSPRQQADAIDLLDWWEEERRCHSWSVRLAVETNGAFARSHTSLRLMNALPQPPALYWDALQTVQMGRESTSETWCRLRRFIHFIRPGEPGPGEVSRLAIVSPQNRSAINLLPFLKQATALRPTPIPFPADV